MVSELQLSGLTKMSALPKKIGIDDTFDIDFFLGQVKRVFRTICSDLGGIK